MIILPPRTDLIASSSLSKERFWGVCLLDLTPKSVFQNPWLCPCFWHIGGWWGQDIGRINLAAEWLVSLIPLTWMQAPNFYPLKAISILPMTMDDDGKLWYGWRWQDFWRRRRRIGGRKEGWGENLNKVPKLKKLTPRLWIARSKHVRIVNKVSRKYLYIYSPEKYIYFFASSSSFHSDLLKYI